MKLRTHFGELSLWDLFLTKFFPAYAVRREEARFRAQCEEEGGKS